MLIFALESVVWYLQSMIRSIHFVLTILNWLQSMVLKLVKITHCTILLKQILKCKQSGYHVCKRKSIWLASTFLYFSRILVAFSPQEVIYFLLENKVVVATEAFGKIWVSREVFFSLYSLWALTTLRILTSSWH